jgi:hypothetical protein
VDRGKLGRVAYAPRQPVAPSSGDDRDASTLAPIPATFRRYFRWPEKKTNASTSCVLGRSANSTRLQNPGCEPDAQPCGPLNCRPMLLFQRFQRSLDGRNKLIFHHFRMCAASYTQTRYGHRRRTEFYAIVIVTLFVAQAKNTLSLTEQSVNYYRHLALVEGERATPSVHSGGQ